MEKTVTITDIAVLTPDTALEKSTWVNNPYIKAATSDNTRKAYRQDIKHYETWGGPLPSTPISIVNYLQAYATCLNPRTLARRLTALRHWHVYQGFPDPSQHPSVQKTMAGIMRLHGKPKDKAAPLLTNDLLIISQFLEQEQSLRACRDNALLQIGFFAAMRRSELVGICVEHISWKPQGIEILIPHSKTDQMRGGQLVGIVYGKNTLCPVTALKKWLEQSHFSQGPLFREIKKGGKIKEAALTPLMVTHILKNRAKQCGIRYANQLSSHSLRRGLATCASLMGANIVEIMRQGRWKQVNTVMEYVEASERFSENVAHKILQEIDEK